MSQKCVVVVEKRSGLSIDLPIGEEEIWLERDLVFKVVGVMDLGVRGHMEKITVDVKTDLDGEIHEANAMLAFRGRRARDCFCGHDDDDDDEDDDDDDEKNETIDDDDEKNETMVKSVDAGSSSGMPLLDE